MPTPTIRHTYATRTDSTKELTVLTTSLTVPSHALILDCEPFRLIVSIRHSPYSIVNLLHYKADNFAHYGDKPPATTINRATLQRAVLLDRDTHGPEHCARLPSIIATHSSIRRHRPSSRSPTSLRPALWPRIARRCDLFHPLRPRAISTCSHPYLDLDLDPSCCFASAETLSAVSSSTRE